MNTIEPTLCEKEKAIGEILEKGLSRPKSLWVHLGEIYRALGLRYIFFDMVTPIIIIAAAAVCLLVLYPTGQGRHIYAMLFLAAPIFFISIVLLTEAMEQAGGMYELKMTCKYTIEQITAFRVLCFSWMGTVFCAPASLYFSRLSVAHDFFRAFSLSLCALFLCAFLTISAMRYFRRKWVHFSIMPLWAAVSLLPVWVLGGRWEAFLSQMPVAVTAMTAAIACALFLMEIKKLMSTREREAAYNAGC